MKKVPSLDITTSCFMKNNKKKAKKFSLLQNAPENGDPKVPFFSLAHLYENLNPEHIVFH
jgi:hypothetical protein